MTDCIVALTRLRRPGVVLVSDPMAPVRLRLIELTSKTRSGDCALAILAAIAAAMNAEPNVNRMLLPDAETSVGAGWLVSTRRRCPVLCPVVLAGGRTHTTFSGGRISSSPA